MVVAGDRKEKSSNMVDGYATVEGAILMACNSCDVALGWVASRRSQTVGR